MGPRPSRGAAGAAEEGEEENAEEGSPSCPQHPSVSSYQLKVLPQEEVIGAVESRRSREPGGREGERERDRER